MTISEHKPQIIKQPSRQALFLVFVLILNLVGLIGLYSSHGTVLDSYVFAYGNDRFMDFFNHMEYSHNLKTAYSVTVHANHPPIYMLYSHFLHRLLPEGSVVNFQAYSIGSYPLLYYAMYCCITTTLLFCAIKATLQNRKYSFLVAFAIFFSYAFMFMVERGNPVMLALILLLFALLEKDKNTFWHKEAALLLFAVAMNIKVYTIVFSLIYLKERRFKEFFRLLIYGVLIFLIPLALFFNLSDIGVMINNMNTVMVPGIGLLSIRPLFQKLSEKLLSVGQTGLIEAIGHAAQWIFTVISLLMFFLSKKKWEGIAILTFIMILFPTWSGEYTVMYMVLPLLYYFVEPQREKLHILISMVFATIFSALYLSVTVRGYMIGMIVPFLGLYSVLAFVWIDVIVSMLKGRRSSPQALRDNETVDTIKA